MTELLNKVTQGDCVEVMRNQVKDNSIDLTVTSPPYDNLRNYNGFVFDFENVAKELYRVTKEGGIVVWVVGDETKNFSESLTSFNQALFFTSIGFKLLDTMIYFKKNYAPAYPTLRRYANQFEYMFVFSKGKPKTFNPVQVEKKESTIDRQKNSRGFSFRQKDGTLINKEIHNTSTTKAASNVWSYQVGGQKTGHPAVFPEKLAEDHILSWSNPGDTILDVFGGSGTTAKMSLLNDRNFIHVDVSEEYCEIASKRIADALSAKGGN